MLEFDGSFYRLWLLHAEVLYCHHLHNGSVREVAIFVLFALNPGFFFLGLSLAIITTW